MARKLKLEIHLKNFPSNYFFEFLLKKSLVKFGSNLNFWTINGCLKQCAEINYYFQDVVLHALLEEIREKGLIPSQLQDMNLIMNLKLKLGKKSLKKLRSQW